jgi:hypothetical protein
VAVLEGSPVALWVPTGTETKVHALAASPTKPHSLADEPAPIVLVELQLAPDRLVVIGRANGYQVPYLDPAYQATTIMPETGQSVLLTQGEGKDIMVSRAHFTLRAAAGGGVILTNGVPQLGGGIRPPMNWTYLLTPVTRVLDPGEELTIGPGAAVAIQLPNLCVLRLAAR